MLRRGFSQFCPPVSVRPLRPCYVGAGKGMSSSCTGAVIGSSSAALRSYATEPASSEQPLAAEQPSPPTNSKPTVVVIGTGWAGARFVKGLDPTLCNIAVLSQRNHMVFTPLLPQTCSGTLEFRSICEPVVRIQPALAQLPNCFYRTMVYDVDFEQKVVQCISVGVLGAGENVPVKSFDFHYDKLVLAHGARPNTFNIPGVEDNAFFLREISEARGIRRRLVQNIMFAKLPVTTTEERKRLLHVVVVGGGPTGVEFAADLADFLHQDIPKIDPRLLRDFKLTLVEANEVLGTFDTTLRNYGARRLEKMGVKLRKAVVAEVGEDSVTLTDGEVLQCGLVVWSTGVGPSSLTKQLKVDKAAAGRIAVNGSLQALKDGKPIPDVYAIGDCAANTVSPLPTLAAVASRQGQYMYNKVNAEFKALNKATVDDPKAKHTPPVIPDFEYKHLGSMASLGKGGALVELQAPGRLDLKGLKAFIIWRSAYFTMLGSVRSRLYVMVNWFGSWIFGRDITYISEISEAKVWQSLARQGASKEQARRKVLKQAEERRLAQKSVTAESLAAEAIKEEEKLAEEAKAKEQQK